MSCGTHLPKTGASLCKCSFPVNFDTYKGCEHGCKYCFANLNVNGQRKGYSFDGDWRGLKKWIDGKRGSTETWCDWNIPICIGRNSDPLQPCEVEHHRTLDCLKLLAETKYPFIITTKGVLLTEREEYFKVISQCNCVVQYSMFCSRMDALEPNAPKYEERLASIAKLKGVVRRTVARWAPNFLEYLPTAMREIPRLKAAGVELLCTETAFLKKPIGKCTMRAEGTNVYVYPVREYEKAYTKIRAACHAHGLMFTTCNCKRMNDSLECCTGGLEGFVPCKCNAPYYYLKRDEYHATAGMKKVGTGTAMHNVLFGREDYSKLKHYSFQQVMENAILSPDVKLQIERG